MTTIVNLALDLASTQGRYSNPDRQKAAGATYTPDELALFVGDAALEAFQVPAEGQIRVLDPAVGDGALLDALLSKLPPDALCRLEVTGFDTDPDAIAAARSRLEKWPVGRLVFHEVNFLSFVLAEYGEQNLFSAPPSDGFDLVVANPPYVRTQVLGADAAQVLAKQFGLTGRVDLYYPFLLGISRVLAPNGVASVIVSNRFMTTKSGQAVRSALLRTYDLLHVWDLGDTKLFDAAVLPAVILAKHRGQGVSKSADSIQLTTIYETDQPASTVASSVLNALTAKESGVCSVPDGRRFNIQRGVLDNGGEDQGLWRVATAHTDDWLATVARNTWRPFKSIGKIRVGVKSTADKVFLRSDWDDLPGGRPELLRPLITRYSARQFKSKLPEKASKRKEILYPHEATESGRRAVDLSDYPIARAYLNSHRQALEARTYVIEGGRQWFEIWVPQDPASWSQPKLVFPDIADEPVFWMDLDGGVVNGECYWLKADDPSSGDLLWLALAVANSSFIKAFYDHSFNNKLYAGRRRFITQYVEQFPLPDPKLASTQKIIELTKEIYSIIPSAEADSLVVALDERVWNAFGLGPEKVAG